jgi:hypothetical protein
MCLVIGNKIREYVMVGCQCFLLHRWSLVTFQAGTEGRGRGIALPVLNPGAKKGTPRPLYPREKDGVLIVQGAGWASGPVWMGPENIAPTGIRTTGSSCP